MNIENSNQDFVKWNDNDIVPLNLLKFTCCTFSEYGKAILT